MGLSYQNYVVDTTLAQMLTSIPEDKLKQIQSAIITAGITREFKGDHRAIFKRLMSSASGRQKKIYAALAKSSRDEMCRMSDAIVMMNK